MSGTHGLLQPNQPGYYYITLEEGYVTLFKINASKWFEEHKDEVNAIKKRDARSAHAVAKAYITDVLENLSKELYKDTGSEQNLWVFLSFPQLEARLHGGVKMRTLKDAMKEMIEDGYVFKRPNRDPRYKSLEYRLNLPKYRKELNELPTKDVSANLHDEIDSAKMHDLSANLHDDDAKMHDASANLHARKNIDITKSKQREKEGTSLEIDSTQMGTPSLTPSSTLSSSFEHLSTNLSTPVEKQASSVHVATEPTSTSEIPYAVTTRNTSTTPNVRKTEELDPLAIYTEQEKQQHYWWLGLQLAVNINLTNKRHWATLSAHVHSQDDMRSLYQHTEKQIQDDPNLKDKTVNPGNLANAKYLNGWKQAQKRKQAPQEAPKTNRAKTVEEMTGLEKAKYWEQKYAKKSTTVAVEERQ